jgi:hypothetical protein
MGGAGCRQAVRRTRQKDLNPGSSFLVGRHFHKCFLRALVADNQGYPVVAVAVAASVGVGTIAGVR